MTLSKNHSENAVKVKQFYLTCLYFLLDCYVRYICTSFLVSGLETQKTENALIPAEMSNLLQLLSIDKKVDRVFSIRRK